jgi:hypothetical protein
VEKKDEVVLLLNYLAELRGISALGTTADLVDESIAKTVSQINKLLFEQ